MNRLSFSRLSFAAITLALAVGAPTAGVQAQSGPGYLWLKAFSANVAGSGPQVSFSGTFVNLCNGGLPPGALLRIFFDQAVLLDVPITAAFGQMQGFQVPVTVPVVPAPRNNETAYRFAIFVPSSAPAPAPTASPDMKTSPCLVTPALGTPR